METIYQKIGAVNKEVSAIDKTRKNEQQNFMFRGIEDFMNELHNLFAKHGIFIIPHECEHTQVDYDYIDSKGNKKVQFRTRVHMVFRFYSSEDGSFIEADGWGEAADNGDKGYNKCKSIALKYVLMQMFLVPTKDIADPDKETPAEIERPKDDFAAVAAASRRPKKAATQPVPTPEAQAEDDKFFLVKQLIADCKTKDDLLKLWDEWPELHEQIKPLFSSKRKELNF